MYVQKLVNPKDCKNQCVHMKDLEVEVNIKNVEKQHIIRSHVKGLGIAYDK